MQSRTQRLVDTVTIRDRERADAMMSDLYGEFRDLARRFLSRESKAESLQPTALVSEAYTKLVEAGSLDIVDHTHFLALGAQAMRRVLVDHARKRLAKKRGGGKTGVEFNEELAVSEEQEASLIALDEALQRLHELDPRQAQIVEMRFFGGLSVEEVARELGLSTRTIESEWTMIRAWLRRELTDAET